MTQELIKPKRCIIFQKAVYTLQTFAGYTQIFGFMNNPNPAELLLSQELARHIKGRRLALKKTQEQVANEAGIDRNHYQNIESGRSDRRTQNPMNPQLFTLARLATALECTISELLNLPGEKYSAAVERFNWR